MSKHFLPYLAVIVLVGCSALTPLQKEVQPDSSLTTYSDTLYGYSIEVDKDDFIGDWTSRKTAGGNTAHSLWNGYLDDEHDVFVDVYHSSESCSHFLTGVSDPAPLSQNISKAMWGRMDFFDGYGLEGWDWPYDPSHIFCSGGGTPPFESVYVLCSQNEEKTVVICINQMTDNPQLAEEIFSTFRWGE